MAGQVVAEGVVEGRAVPWKSPTLASNGRGGLRVDRHARGYSDYLAWKQEVALRAAQYRPRGGPYGGEVELQATFYLRTRSGTVADTTNLMKSFEDALQGVIYQNDRQVVATRARRITSRTERERVEFVVLAAE